MHLALGSGCVATLRDGSIVGTALWWKYGHSAGALGLVIVDPDFQGRGIGQRLLSSALASLGQRNVQLVATRAGMAQYLRAGFQPLRQIVQLRGQPGALQHPVAPRLTLKTVTGADVPTLENLDAAATRMHRGPLLHSLVQRGGGYLLERDGHPVGFALQRRGGQGTIVGPVVARDQADAQVLISELLAGAAGLHRIDIPREAGALISWLQKGGLIEVDEGTLMQNGALRMAPAVPLHCYALASQALG